MRFVITKVYGIFAIYAVASTAIAGIVGSLGAFALGDWQTENWLWQSQAMHPALALGEVSFWLSGCTALAAVCETGVNIFVPKYRQECTKPSGVYEPPKMCDDFKGDSDEHSKIARW